MSDSKLDSRVHHAVLRGIVDRGAAPTAAEMASALRVGVAEMEAALLRLHENHGLVLHPGTTEIWIAHPFSVSPAAAWVVGETRGWWSPCIWCAMGIVTLTAPSATIHARIGGESEGVAIRVKGGKLLDEGLVVHFAVPLRDAWKNVVHYCATVLPFRGAGDVDAWCERHRFAQGAVVPLSQVLDLGRAWYGRHLDPDWQKWTVREARALFERVGLTGEFWSLPAVDRPF